MDKKETSTTIKIWNKTLRKLRMIYALTGERMVIILDRLVDNELKRLEVKSEKSVSPE